MPDCSRMTIPGLIHRMNAAADFGYDDEGAELTRRLAPKGQDWVWEKDGLGNERVVIIDKEGTTP